MNFEWDDGKNQINIEKHQIDFRDVINMFDGRPVNAVRSTFEYEERFLTTLVLDDGRSATVVWTMRGEKIRVISARRARSAEEWDHRKLYDGRT